MVLINEKLCPFIDSCRHNSFALNFTLSLSINLSISRYLPGSVRGSFWHHLLYIIVDRLWGIETLRERRSQDKFPVSLSELWVLGFPGHGLSADCHSRLIYRHSLGGWTTIPRQVLGSCRVSDKSIVYAADDDREIREKDRERIFHNGTSILERD